jgi:hypothetical protein
MHKSHLAETCINELRASVRLCVSSTEVDINDIVTYRLIARQRLDKHVPAETDSW